MAPHEIHQGSDIPKPDTMQRKKRVKSWWEIREKLSKLSPQKLKQYLRKLFSRDRAGALAKSHSGRESSSPAPASFEKLGNAQIHPESDRTQLATRLSLDQSSNYVSESSRTLSIKESVLPKAPDLQLDLILNELNSNKSMCSGIDILVRFPGEGPDKTHQISVSIDTQCKGVNLMRREIWDRLNADGRHSLELPDEFYVKNLGTEKHPVIGIARGLEWHFKNGQKTYTSDFHIIDMGLFDALIGTETIWQYRLVKPGADLQHHLKTSARKAQRVKEDLQ